MAYLIGLAMAHVTSVHYAISNPFIYTIIFYFYFKQYLQECTDK